VTTQTETAQKTHGRAVRFFWCFLIAATAISLVGNVAHAVLPYIPHVVIHIGAAAVPPIALLAAASRSAWHRTRGPCGRVRQHLPLGGRRRRRGRVCGELPGVARPHAGDRVQRRDGVDLSRDHRHDGGGQHDDAGCAGGQASASRSRGGSTRAWIPDQRAGADHAVLAQALVDAGATTKPAAVVASILAAHTEGTALNRIASDMGIHHKTVSRIIDTAEDRRRQLVAV
jgi:hypothetical protein